MALLAAIVLPALFLDHDLVVTVALRLQLAEAPSTSAPTCVLSPSLTIKDIVDVDRCARLARQLIHTQLVVGFNAYCLPPVLICYMGPRFFRVPNVAFECFGLRSREI